MLLRQLTATTGPICTLLLTRRTVMQQHVCLLQGPIRSSSKGTPHTTPRLQISSSISIVAAAAAAKAAVLSQTAEAEAEPAAMA